MTTPFPRPPAHRGMLLVLCLLLCGCGDPVPGTWYVSGKRFEPSHTETGVSFGPKGQLSVHSQRIPDAWYISLVFRPSVVESEKGMPWWQTTRWEKQVSEREYNSRSVGDVWKTGW